MSEKTIQVLTSNTADRKMATFYTEKRGFRNVLASFLSDKCRKKYGNVFVCTICCTMYHLQASLQDHIRGAHLNTFKCGHCHNAGKEFVFVTRGNFVSHVNQYHKGMDKSVKSHIVIPRPEVRQLYAIDQTATLKQYSKAFLEKALRLYCATEGIELVGLSSQDNSDGLNETGTSTGTQSIEQMATDLRNEALIGNRIPLPICVRRSCDIDSAPETPKAVLESESASVQDLEISTTSIEPVFEKSQFNNNDISGHLTPQEKYTAAAIENSSCSFLFDPSLSADEITAQLKIWKPMFIDSENTQSASWKEACQLLYKESYSTGNIHGFLFDFWMKAETGTAMSSDSTMDVTKLSQDCIVLVKKIMYGLVDKSNCSEEDSYKMCKILGVLDEQSKLAVYIDSCLKQKMKLSIIEKWIMEKDLLETEAARQIVNWFVLRNPSQCFDPEGPLVSIMPFEMLEACQFKNQASGRYIEIDHCQLLDFLYKWTCNALRLKSEANPKLLQQKVSTLRDLINPNIFSFDQSLMTEEIVAKLKRASFFYFRLFCTDFETVDFSKTYTEKPFHYEIQPVKRFISHTQELQQLIVDRLFSEELANGLIMFDQSRHVNFHYLKHLCPTLMRMRTLTEMGTDSEQCSLQKLHLPSTLDNPVFKKFLQCCHDPLLSPSYPTEIEALFYLAVLFKVDTLKSHLYNSMKNRKALWTPSLGILMLCEAVRMKKNNEFKECKKFVKHHFDKLLECEAFYSIIDKDTMLMLLETPMPVQPAEKVIASVYKWCVVQSLVDPLTDLENLKRQVKPFLKFADLTREARIKMQEETNFLSIREYDTLCVEHAQALLRHN